MGNFDDIGTGVVEEVAAIAAAVWSLVSSARNALIVSWAVMASSVRATRCLLSSISLLSRGLVVALWCDFGVF